jgi:vacuolar-type H+-ATPase subunit E/Vma4
MPRLFSAPILALALVVAPPLARACDPEAMNQEITEICRAALNPATEIARAALARATPEEARALAAAISAAGDACDVGDPAAGARQAVEIARLAGRIEARTL